jgi:hypothetical protein
LEGHGNGAGENGVLSAEFQSLSQSWFEAPNRLRPQPTAARQLRLGHTTGRARLFERVQHSLRRRGIRGDLADPKAGTASEVEDGAFSRSGRRRSNGIP